MKLSITTAWNEASAFVKQEAGALFLIAFALMTLPSIILQAIAGRMVGPLQPVPGAMPDFKPFLAALPVLCLLFIPVMLLSVWGHLTINILALRREAVIGDAFRRAARRILPLVGAWLLLSVAALVLVLPIVGLGFSGALAPARLGFVFLLFFILWLAFVFVAVRLALITPVAAAEPLGPIGIIQRSWALTAGHFWKLLGFLLLIVIVYAIIAGVITAVIGMVVTLTIGQPNPGSLSSFLIQLVAGVLQAVFVTYLAVTVARIYEQLSGNIASVGQVFE